MIGSRNEQRVVGQAVPVQRLHNSADTIVGLHDKVSIEPETAFAFEFGPRTNWRVGRCQRHVKKERSTAPGGSGVLSDKGLSLSGKRVQHFDVFKILGRRPNAIKGTPSFLRGYLSDPTPIFHERIRIHVQRSGQYECRVKSELGWPNF